MWCGEMVLYVKSLGGLGWSGGEEEVKSGLRGRRFHGEERRQGWI